MPDTLKVNEDLGIIEVLSQGKVAKHDLENSLKKMMEIHEQTGICKVLVDTSKQESTPRSIDLFNFGEKISHTARHFRYAIVTSKQNSEDQLFLETVITNRGSEIKAFNNKENALNWLLREIPSPS